MTRNVFSDVVVSINKEAPPDFDIFAWIHRPTTRVTVIDRELDGLSMKHVTMLTRGCRVYANGILTFDLPLQKTWRLVKIESENVTGVRIIPYSTLYLEISPVVDNYDMAGPVHVWTNKRCGVYVTGGFGATPAIIAATRTHVVPPPPSEGGVVAAPQYLTSFAVPNNIVQALYLYVDSLAPTVWVTAMMPQIQVQFMLPTNEELQIAVIVPHDQTIDSIPSQLGAFGWQVDVTGFFAASLRYQLGYTIAPRYADVEDFD
jgi:hypothetical protein